MGKTKDAKAAFAQVLKLQPKFARPYLQATYPFRNPAHTQLFEQALIKGGWAE